MRALRRPPDHWAHDPDWHTYTPEGEPWFGFDAVRRLNGLPPEILLIPLAGHSPGHSGVAIQGDDGWLLHAGDAYFDHGELTGEGGPALIRAFQRTLDDDSTARVQNQFRLQKLHGAQKGVEIFCAHDKAEFPG